MLLLLIRRLLWEFFFRKDVTVNWAIEEVVTLSHILLFPTCGYLLQLNKRQPYP